jgi:hypothetical protein
MKNKLRPKLESKTKSNLKKKKNLKIFLSKRIKTQKNKKHEEHRGTFNINSATYNSNHTTYRQTKDIDILEIMQGSII